MFHDYVARCRRGEMRLGQPYLFKRLVEPCILNFPTKDDWRSLTRLSTYGAALSSWNSIIAPGESSRWPYRHWAVDLANWNSRLSGPTLYRYLKRLEIQIQLYAPRGTPEEQVEFAFLEGAGEPDAVSSYENGYKINPGWVALVEILARVESEPYHRPIGRTSFQKEAYFATQSGIPTGLEFERGRYGPFAAGLKSIISRLQNNQLIREEKLGRMLAVKPGPTFMMRKDVLDTISRNGNPR